MSSISGNVTFYGNSINDSTDPTAIVGIPLFLDNSSNQGVISSGIFSGSAFNAGEVQTTATFVGSAVNSGVVAIATFNDGAVNFGTITSSGLFYGTAVNSGVISGNAIFADTAANNGTVEGDADFAAGASNQGGTVNGTTGVYTPPGGHGDGAYSDGYYTNGVIDTSYSSEAPSKAIDDNLWYSYSNGVSALFADGAFFDGDIAYPGYYSISNGTEVYTYPNGVKMLVNTNNSGFYYSFDGTLTTSANRANGAIEIAGSWYSIADGVKEATATFNGAGIGQPNNAYYPIVNGSLNNTNYANGVLISATNGLYYNFSQQSGALPASPFNGAININNSWFSIVDGVRESSPTFTGFYEQSSSIYVMIENGTVTNNSAIGVVKNINGLYYYLSAVNTLVGLANGAYSNGYFTNGVFDSSYSTTALNALDNNKWYVYANGVATGYATGYTVQSGLTNTITIDGNAYNNGTYDIVVDINGDEVSGNNQYASSGTEFYNDGSVYKYVSDGIGGYTQVYISANTVLLANQTNTINITQVSQVVNNGTYDVLADGNGSTINGNYQYPSVGTVLYDNNTVNHYVADGNGGYNEYVRTGYLIQNDAVNNITINSTAYANGTFDEVADGDGTSTFVYTYAIAGTEFFVSNGISYQSDGNGGYTEVPV